MSLLRLATLVFAGIIATGASAAAQPIGTFRWQLQPYCNIISVNVTQQGAIYTLDGTDDRCGGGNQPGSLVGIAYLTPLGLVGFGLTSVLPNGTPIHTEATLSIATLNGTWRDHAGNNGTFVFTPGAGVGGAPRPIPSGGIAPASITNVQIANNAVTGTNVVDASITSADIGDAPRSDFHVANDTIPLTATDAVIRTVSINAPVAGKILLTASGYFNLNSALAIDEARCSISTGTTHVFANSTYVRERAAGAMDIVPFAITRGFAVSAGVNTFNLICDELSGDVGVERSALTAIFVAQ
jgi:hypothetical protein